MPPQRVEQRTQATPLSEDVLSFLRQQLGAGQAGAGVGPLQREAGTAARQFVLAGGGRAPQINVEELISAIEAGSRRTVGESAADLREAFGAAGTRFGTPLATGEARLRRGAAEDLSRTTAATRLGAEQFNIGVEQENARTLLAGIQLLNEIGRQGFEPFIQLAALGIQPDLFQQHPLITGIDALANLAQGAGSIAAGGGLGALG